MRLASFDPGITEILYFFERNEEIVCRSAEVDYPESAKHIPVWDGSLEHLDELSPELLFFGGEGTEEFTKQLQDRNLSAFWQNPQTINELYEAVRQLGLILQQEKEPEALVLQMQQGLKDVKRKAGLLPRRATVQVDLGEPLPAWVRELVHIAGGELVAGEADILVIAEGDSRIKTPQVRSLDPALLLRGGPRLVEGCQRVYGWLFESLH